jgi:hypothetical protein
MTKILTGTFAVLAVIGVSRAQNTPQPANQQTASAQAAQSTSAQINGVRIAPGSVIPVELTKTIDSKKLKTGEEVEAKVTQDLKTQDGEVIVARYRGNRARYGGATTHEGAKGITSRHPFRSSRDEKWNRPALADDDPGYRSASLIKYGQRKRR